MEWKKFTLKTTFQAIELVSALLAEQGIDSFEIEDNKQISKEDKKAMYIDILPEIEENDLANIIFYLESDISTQNKDKILSELKNGLLELKDFVNVGSCEIIEDTTQDTDWINKWKEFFKSFSIDDILIKPTWEKTKDTEKYKIVINIDPGTAFGTGLHETTQLCIRQLRKYIDSSTSILDVGCGSGILSIIAMKLGAKTALGTDIDKAAITASKENAKVNEVLSNIEFITGNIIDDKSTKDKVGYEGYDIVVANILADIIIPLSKVITPHMKVGGLFITSGIIFSKEEAVVSAINSNGALQIKEITRQKDWVSITAIRIK